MAELGALVLLLAGFLATCGLVLGWAVKAGWGLLTIPVRFLVQSADWVAISFCLPVALVYAIFAGLAVAGLVGLSSSRLVRRQIGPFVARRFQARF